MKKQVKTMHCKGKANNGNRLRYADIGTFRQEIETTVINMLKTLKLGRSTIYKNKVGNFSKEIKTISKGRMGMLKMKKPQ